MAPTMAFSGPLAIAQFTVGMVIGGCLVIFGGGMAIRALGAVLFAVALILAVLVMAKVN